MFYPGLDTSHQDIIDMCHCLWYQDIKTQVRSVWRQSDWSNPWQEMTLRRLSDSRITQAEVSCSQTLTMLWLWFKLRNIISHLRPSFTSQQEQIELCQALVDILYSDSIDAVFSYFSHIFPFYIMTVAATTVTKITCKSFREAFYEERETILIFVRISTRGKWCLAKIWCFRSSLWASKL